MSITVDISVDSAVERVKTSKSDVKIPKDLEFFEPLIQKEQTLSIDVMTAEQNHFLTTVTRPLDLTLSTSIKSLKAKDVKKALRNQLDLLKQKNITAVKVGFNTITPFLNSNGIEHDVCGAGTHVGIVAKSKRSRIELVPL
jgi:hypothetical protein